MEPALKDIPPEGIAKMGVKQGLLTKLEVAICGPEKFLLLVEMRADLEVDVAATDSFTSLREIAKEWTAKIAELQK